MIFDQPPAELPVATLVPREHQTRWRADLLTWLATKWRWFKPRTVPMIVAFIGMLAVVGSANYLRNFARRTPVEQAVTPELARVQWTLHVSTDVPPGMKVAAGATKEPERRLGCCGGRPCE